MKYIDIKDNENHGTNFDAVLSNLGYCMASTTSNNFYENIFRIGMDLAKIVFCNNTNDEANSILKTSINNSKYIGCSCSKNEYNINSCHIQNISQMISSLSSYSNRTKNLVSSYFDKNNIVDFYTMYFVILKDCNTYNSLFENPSKLLSLKKN